MGLVLLVAACGGKKGGSSDDGGSGEQPATNVPQTGDQPNTSGGDGDPVVPLPNDGGTGNNGGGSGGGSGSGSTTGDDDDGAPTAKIYFAKGYLVTRFPSDVSTQGNFQGWNPTLRPSRVANGSVLTTDYVVKTVERE